jgi:hypothetical protein
MLPKLKWISEFVKCRARWRKEVNQLQKFKPLASCSWNLISSCLSSLFVLFLFPLKNIYFWKSLVLSRYYYWDIIKATQASHGLTETCQNGHWKNNVTKRGERWTHTFWDRWTCANGKEWSRGTNKVLVIGLHMVGKMSMGLDLASSWSF